MTTSKAGASLESTVDDPDNVAWTEGRPSTGHLGRYRVRGTLGSGGMGIVVAAHDPQLDRDVAIKLLPAQHRETARLFREAKAMARLSHPNVVTVHEVVAVGDRAGIVMELVDGEDLAAWSGKGPREWREVIGVYVQAARGLAAAHHAGIVHRDFKPSNVLFGNDGIVRVSDFGLARSLSGRESELRCDLAEGVLPTITRSGAVVGTPAYMAPEQHEHGTVDERTDQWAFACSLHEALFGARPFGDDREGLRDRVLRGEIVEPSESNVPRAIRVALRRALAVKPDDRFASMDELIAALMAPLVRRSRLAWAAVAAIAIAALAAVIAVMRSTNDDTVCAGLDTPLQAAWNPAKSQQLRERMLAAGQPDAIADGVVLTLEEHSAAWLASRTTACTHAHQGLASAEQLDRQMRCLDQYLVELGGVVDGLLDPAATKLRSAAGVIDRLRPISDCDDPHEAIPRPIGAAARDAIATAETDLARAQALDELDQYERALALAQSAADVGKRTGWVPLEGRALAVVGECQQRLRRFNESFAAYERAASAAAAAHDDALFADVLVQRFLVLAENIGRPPEALAGRPYIELALVRAGQAPRMRASWLHALAIGLFRQLQLDEALAAEREAVTIWRTLVRPRSTRLIDSLETEANIQIQSRHFAEAETLLREVLPARIVARGPDDESVARAENNWGWLEFERNDFEAAHAHYERAARINAAAGTANFRIQMNLGIVEAELGQLHAGLADFEAARENAIREATDTSPHVVECEVAVAGVLTALGEYDRARPMLDRGLAEAGAARAPILTEALFASARFALAHGDRATAAKRLAEYAQVNKDPSDHERAILEAEVTRAQSGCRAARPVIERALAAVRDGPYQSERIQAAVVGARCDVELGEPVRALAVLDPPLGWYEARHADIEVIAGALFAKALAVAAQGDLKRARTLAERARSGLFGADRDEVMRWLARHPARTGN